MCTFQGFKEELRQWDTSFWAERLREDKYNITDEELRPYFALPNVLEGLFQVQPSPAHYLFAAGCHHLVPIALLRSRRACPINPSVSV